MFLCHDCHKVYSEHPQRGEAVHPPWELRSDGPCEQCGVSGSCFDCHCPPGASVGAPTPEETGSIVEDLQRLRDELA